MSEVNATFAAEHRALLHEAARTIGKDRIVFLPDNQLFLYRDEQGAEHVADYRLHLSPYDRALELDCDEDSDAFIPTPNEQTLTLTPKRTEALNTLRQTPAYPPVPPRPHQPDI